MNTVTLIGRLGQDPETQEAGGSTVTKFSIATSQRWKDKDGNQQERTEWHNCEAWGKVGSEVIQKYVQKGHQLALSGEIRYDKYEKDGEKRTATKIRVKDIQLLQNAKSEDSSSGVDEDIPF